MLLTALATVPVLADPPDEPLETVVVSAMAAGYGAPPGDTFLRTASGPLDVPQSVTVLSDQWLRDRAPASMAEALMTVPGVGINQGEGNRDSVILRGIPTTADFLIDGLRDDLQYFRDFYNVQQLEVLTGPNGLLSGHGVGGGVVNRVTRQAGVEVRDLGLARSSQNGWRATADLGQRWTAHSAGRLNLLWEDADSYRDEVTLLTGGNVFDLTRISDKHLLVLVEQRLVARHAGL
jgi:catecholate siderophore receptor